MDGELQHFGVLRMRWGVRRTPEQLGRRAERRDVKWLTKGRGSRAAGKIESRVTSKVGTLQPGKLSRTQINQYNQKLAALMNERAIDLKAPSGRVVRFVAKRGEVGGYRALADQGYNMDQLKRGIWAGGRVAYRKDVVVRAGGGR